MVLVGNISTALMLKDLGAPGAWRSRQRACFRMFAGISPLDSFRGVGSAGSWSGHFVQLADSCRNELLSVWSEHQAVSTCRAEKLYFMEMPGPGVQ